jgi:hypothetical protein
VAAALGLPDALVRTCPTLSERYHRRCWRGQCIILEIFRSSLVRSVAGRVPAAYISHKRLEG